MIFTLESCCCLHRAQPSWNLCQEYKPLGTGNILLYVSFLLYNLQLVHSGRFAMYDYGSKKKNEEHYGQVSSINRQCNNPVFI